MTYRTRKRGGKYSREYIAALKNKINFYDVINSFTILRKVNENYAYGLCPIHREKTPSFSFSEKEQFFYCFGCGMYTRNPIEFVARVLWARATWSKFDYDIPFREECSSYKPSTNHNIEAIRYLARMYSYWPAQHTKYKKGGRPG